jgi:RNA polymerase sigma-70 factor (ECF subfamily)
MRTVYPTRSTAAADLDAADVAAVLAGDRERFAGVVERWQGPLHNLAFCFVRDAALAEDLTQDALLQAYRRLSRWRGEAPFRTWLYSVALNVYRSHLRRRGLPGEPLLDVHADPRPSPSEAAASGESEERVRAELARLPATYREALALFYLEERDLAAAAAALGVPEGTLKARLFRGRELLRRRLRRLMP